MLSKDRIINPSTARSIINDCIKNQTHFYCHKSTIQGKEIICNRFYDQFGHHSQLVRIAQRLDCLQFVDQTDNEKLITYTEMQKK